MEEKRVKAMLLASPVGHSLSPVIHNTAFNVLGLNWQYTLKEVDEASLPKALDSLRQSSLKGVNLSMPNKVAAVPLLDELSPEAQAIGAVNTIANCQGKLIGYNTDGSGFLRSLTALNFSVLGKKAVILGCGGAGKSVIYSLAQAGAAEVTVVKRRNQTFSDKTNELKSLLRDTNTSLKVIDFSDEELIQGECQTADLLVNTTNVGMAQSVSDSPLPVTIKLDASLLVCDLIYQPSETVFLKWAKSQGCQVSNGLSMLVYQAAAAFEIWTDLPMPVDEVFTKLNDLIG